MQKTKKKIISIISKLMVTCLVVILILIQVQVKAESSNNNVFDEVRVGMFFKNSSSPNVSNEISYFNISSPKGVEAGYLKDGEFFKIFDTGDGSVLTVRKDSYYIIDGASIQECKPGANNLPEESKIGPFHIQVGGSYDNYETVKTEVDKYIQKGINVYPAYTDSWYIWTGFYVDQNSAEQNIKNSLIPKIGEEKYSIVQPSKNNIVVTMKSNETRLIFGNSEGYFQVRPRMENNPYIFNINGKNYRGIIETRRLEESDLTVINILPIEHYLYGVVPSEIEWSSHPEALKAQAVAARTYIYNNMGKYSKLGFDVCSSVNSQVYGGFSVEKETTNKAVDETQGKKLYYNSVLAQVFYFSSSGGRTEAAKNVWSEDLPYLQSVEDKYEQEGSKNYTWEKTISAAKAGDIMVSLGNDIGEVLRITIDNTSEAGRAIKMTVAGTKGEKVFLNSRCRDLLSLPSQWFTISTDSDAAVWNSSANEKISVQVGGKKVVSVNGSGTIAVNGNISVLGDNGLKRIIPAVPSTYTFSGRGYGHAVGMSQQGAKGMANAGFTYEDILLHYFYGTNIKYE
ncbi:MAG TPA: SpoIID/LytB domain-containing protein [Clostridiales bacterium]|nr:SpoIID/LytB domain-containing protein [Clostridiales bacterium]